MSLARRSVTDTEIRRYEAFAQSMKNTAGGSAFFRFPEGGVDGGNGAEQQNGMYTNTNSQFARELTMNAGAGEEDLYD
jgi:transitional endoplasmic reticulum ATPase